MGSELVRDSSPQQGGGVQGSAPISYTKLFYEALPYYLAMGMSWDEFWNDDCIKAKYYREADRIRHKVRNQELWLQGMYIYEAIGDMAPILRFTFDKKPRKAIEYSKQPYPIDEKEMNERKEQEAREKEEKIQAKMKAWMNKFNAQKGGEPKCP